MMGTNTTEPFQVLQNVFNIDMIVRVLPREAHLNIECKVFLSMGLDDAEDG